MRLSDSHIKWIMLVSGALTCTTIYAFVAPQAALTSTFGASVEGPVASVVVRNWGALITLIGAMLIYGAFHPNVRRFALIVATASKVVFIALVLAQGSRFLGSGGDFVSGGVRRPRKPCQLGRMPEAKRNCLFCRRHWGSPALSAPAYASRQEGPVKSVG